MSDFAVLVASADDRKDIFDTCFSHSERIWKDCDWPRYAGFTSRHPHQYGFDILVAKPTGEWRTEVIQYVDALPEQIRYILLMVEDALFIEPVDGAKLTKYGLAAKQIGLNYLRLVPKRKSWIQKLVDVMSTQQWRPYPFDIEVKTNQEWQSYSFEAILPDEPYYSSTEMTLWSRHYLRDLLTKPADAWSFERHVTDTFHYAITHPFLHQHQIIQKGKWNWDAPRYLAKAGLPPPPPGRRYQALSTRLRGHWQNFNFALFGFASMRVKQWLS